VNINDLKSYSSIGLLLHNIKCQHERHTTIPNFNRKLLQGSSVDEKWTRNRLFINRRNT